MSRNTEVFCDIQRGHCWLANNAGSITSNVVNYAAYTMTAFNSTLSETPFLLVERYCASVAYTNAVTILSLKMLKPDVDFLTNINSKRHQNKRE